MDMIELDGFLLPLHDLSAEEKKFIDGSLVDAKNYLLGGIRFPKKMTTYLEIAQSTATSNDPMSCNQICSITVDGKNYSTLLVNKDHPPAGTPPTMDTIKTEFPKHKIISGYKLKSNDDEAVDIILSEILRRVGKECIKRTFLIPLRSTTKIEIESQELITNLPDDMCCFCCIRIPIGNGKKNTPGTTHIRKRKRPNTKTRHAEIVDKPSPYHAILGI